MPQLRTDDGPRKLRAVWLGPAGSTLPFQWTYVQWAVTLCAVPLGIGLLWLILSGMGLPLSWVWPFAIPWGGAGAVYLSVKIMSGVTFDEPLRYHRALVSTEWSSRTSEPHHDEPVRVAWVAPRVGYLAPSTLQAMDWWETGQLPLSTGVGGATAVIENADDGVETVGGVGSAESLSPAEAATDEYADDTADAATGLAAENDTDDRAHAADLEPPDERAEPDPRLLDAFRALMDPEPPPDEHLPAAATPPQRDEHEVGGSTPGGNPYLTRRSRTAPLQPPEPIPPTEPARQIEPTRQTEPAGVGERAERPGDPGGPDHLDDRDGVDASPDEPWWQRSARERRDRVGAR